MTKLTAPTLTTVSAWAVSLGMTRQAGHKAVHRCGIPLTDGKVDPAVATVMYQQRTRARVRNVTSSSRAGSLIVAGRASSTAVPSSCGGAQSLHERAAVLKRAELLGLEASTAINAGSDRDLSGLREAMRSIAIEDRHLLALPAIVWDALVADVAAVLEDAPGAGEAKCGDGDASTMGAVWFAAAAGELIAGGGA